MPVHKRGLAVTTVVQVQLHCILLSRRKIVRQIAVQQPADGFVDLRLIRFHTPERPVRHLLLCQHYVDPLFEPRHTTTGSAVSGIVHREGLWATLTVKGNATLRESGDHWTNRIAALFTANGVDKVSFTSNFYA